MTIIVHTLEDAVAALEAAEELNVPVTLQSAPDAIFYAGSLYLLHLFEQAQKLCPGAKGTFVLDAADGGAEALAAMQVGHKRLRTSADEQTRAQLKDIASQNGITIVEGTEPTLDLAGVRDARAACLEWLKKAQKPSID